MSIVVDSSVILAVLKQEPGGDDSWLFDATASTVNLAEVATKLMALGYTKDQITTVMSGLPVKAIGYTQDLVNLTAYLYEDTRQYGLSLGDRACLATAIAHKLPILTADRIWKELEAELDLDIRLIR